MKKNFGSEETTTAIRVSANTLVDDIVEDNFVYGASVSWLAHKPTNLREAAENLYERLRTIGITLGVDRQEFITRITNRNSNVAEAQEIASCAVWVSECEEWTSSFDSDNINQQDIGEAAFLRSDYRKQNGDS